MSEKGCKVGRGNWEGKTKGLRPAWGFLLGFLKECQRQGDCLTRALGAASRRGAGHKVPGALGVALRSQVLGAGVGVWDMEAKH